MIIDQIKSQLKDIGGYGLLLSTVVRDISRNGLQTKEFVHQLIKIGTMSLPIIVLTGLFTGMVLALQTAYGLARFGAKNYVGNIVGISLARELGPVLTALMVAGRVGSGIAAEIGSMKVTEQIDAIRALGASPISKLVTPRLLAAIIALPCLTIFTNVIGVYGGALIAIFELDISSHLYFNSMTHMVVISDVIDGLIKSCIFGLLIVLISCYHGLSASGGTAGVGEVTTRSVVSASIYVIVSDFLVTKILILIGS